MGISIGTSRTDLSMGYVSFQTFRIEVAKAFSADFGRRYEYYLNESLRMLIFEKKEELNLLDKQFNKYLKTVDIPVDVVDFLFQCDTGGKISYKTAEKIRDLCRKSECKHKFGYTSYALSMAEISEIFDDAVKHKCQVKWS